MYYYSSDYSKRNGPMLGPLPNAPLLIACVSKDSSDSTVSVFRASLYFHFLSLFPGTATTVARTQFIKYGQPSWNSPEF